MDESLGLMDLSIDSEIPSEIVDLIIDQLRADAKTLRLCSLVCQSWLPRARYHLFSTFKIHTRSIAAIDLLGSPLCTIQPYVRRVKFSVSEKLDTAPMATCIQELDNGSSNLLSLSIRTVRGDGMTPVDDHLRALLSAPVLKNLRHLKLKYLRFNSPNYSIKLFSSLPALESLVLYGVGSRIKDDRNTYTTPLPPNLRHLFIWTTGIPHELFWLATHPKHPLTTLHLYNITSASCPIILNYLRQSSQLQCLSFDLCDGATTDSLLLDFMTQIDLTSQQNLRCLRISCNQVVSSFSNLLPWVSSPHLEEITISTWENGSHGSIAWADLRKVFMSSSVLSLKRLYVDDAHIHDILEALPEFASRGIILPLQWGDFGRTTTKLSLPADLY
ncbi:hypothetical protein BD779DRAFT_1677351 [Infundibulicybe gibba]|nr:hypothetical protein BD779DRAFT_1677351 [Infundibulicybe gibba]